MEGCKRLEGTGIWKGAWEWEGIARYESGMGVSLAEPGRVQKPGRAGTREGARVRGMGVGGDTSTWAWDWTGV